MKYRSQQGSVTGEHGVPRGHTDGTDSNQSFTLKNRSLQTSLSLFSGQAGLTRFFLSRRLYCDDLVGSACHMTFRVGGGRGT